MRLKAKHATLQYAAVGVAVGVVGLIIGEFRWTELAGIGILVTVGGVNFK